MASSRRRTKRCLLDQRPGALLKLRDKVQKHTETFSRLFVFLVAIYV